MANGMSYPGRLLSAVNHAERFCIFLSRMDARRGNVTALAWLLGRRQETASFIDHVGRDYRRGRLDEAGAAACIDAHLAALHAGLAANFGERAPACCEPFLKVTAVPPRPSDNTPTTMYVRPRRLKPPARPPRPEPPRPRVPTPEDSATWIDVEADQLLAGLPTRVV